MDVETGRYYRISLENKTCKLCKQSIEDEIHFVIICPCLNEIRNKYIQTLGAFINCDPFEKFIDIMQNENARAVVNFVNDLWQFRSKKLISN